MPLTNLTGTDQFDIVETKLDATIDAVNEIQAGSTDQIFKKSSSTDFDFEATNSVLPASGTNNLKVKVVSIGDWNMDSTATLNVAHGIADHLKIRSVSVVINNDVSGSMFNLDIPLSTTGVVQGGWTIGSTNIGLFRLTGGVFDDALYNSTSFNRGYITIMYEG